MTSMDNPCTSVLMECIDPNAGADETKEEPKPAPAPVMSYYTKPQPKPEPKPAQPMMMHYPPMMTMMSKCWRFD